MLKHGVRINNYGGKLFIRSRLFIGLSQYCLLEQDLDFIAYDY